ncbi:hypothetical protein EX530_13575 [Xanthomonas phaseoli]
MRPQQHRATAGGKAVANDATALDAATTLRAATLGGARALGFQPVARARLRPGPLATEQRLNV